MANVLTGGAPLTTARAAAILVHGRGASAQDILSLGAEFDQDDIAYLAPQAPNGTCTRIRSSRRSRRTSRI